MHYWQHFPHGADLGVRGIGETREAAFAQAALALTAAVTEPQGVVAATSVPIACSAPDNALLLVDWLNALIYEMAVRRMLFSRFELTISDESLQAVAWGEPVDVVRHEPAVEPKGATLTELEVARRPDGLWYAQCVIDV